MTCIVGIIDGKKRVIAVPGHERFDIPLIEKKKAQVLSSTDSTITVMDLESYETLELPKGNFEEKVTEEDKIEYWDIEGKKMVKRKI